MVGGFVPATVIHCSVGMESQQQAENWWRTRQEPKFTQDYLSQAAGAFSSSCFKRIPFWRQTCRTHPAFQFYTLTLQFSFFLQKREMTDRADHHVSDNLHRFLIFPASMMPLLYSQLDWQLILVLESHWFYLWFKNSLCFVSQNWESTNPCQVQNKTSIKIESHTPFPNSWLTVSVHRDIQSSSSINPFLWSDSSRKLKFTSSVDFLQLFSLSMGPLLAHSSCGAYLVERAQNGHKEFFWVHQQEGQEGKDGKLLLFGGFVHLLSRKLLLN